MLFKNLYTWVKYKTLPPSALFKNRLFIERNSQSKRILNNFTWTFRSSKWTNTQLSSIPLSLKYFLFIYVTPFIFFVLSCFLFLYLYKNYYFFFIFKNLCFILWFSVDLVYYFIFYFIWVFVYLVTLVWNVIYIQESGSTKLFKVKELDLVVDKQDYYNFVLLKNYFNYFNFKTIFSSLGAVTDKTFVKIFKPVSSLNLLLLQTTVPVMDNTVHTTCLNLFKHLTSLPVSTYVWNHVNFFSLSGLSLPITDLKVQESVTNRLSLKYPELMLTNQLFNSLYLNLQQYRWLYKYSLLHRASFKPFSLFNKDFLWLNTQVNKSSLLSNLWLTQIQSENPQLQNLTFNLNPTLNYTNYTFLSYSWFIKRTFFFNNLKTQSLVTNFLPKNVVTHQFLPKPTVIKSTVPSNNGSSLNNHLCIINPFNTKLFTTFQLKPIQTQNVNLNNRLKIVNRFTYNPYLVKKLTK